ncbi:unnamed protein product [Arctia plantaginis]|uniref:Uncharacterized protein n=1 Tax=Arctia plantaginis TaxID=874455 RepID=A0A8S1AEL2_ARCPL|nr:unnamed protein product [Arctia plantaginis]CAB3249043.1 unnamed protein product [Arctia plantaginis]
MNSSNKPIIVNLEIGDQLTAISCGHIIVELVKFITYQRLQIPYTYQWLKQVVNRKRACVDEDTKDSFQSQIHFRTVSTALENLDFILKSLQQEINSPSLPDEVCIALGATPVTCKEVYRVLLPMVCHKPQCHSTQIANDQKIHNSVFRTLVTSEKLSHVFFNQIAPTNLYVFIKKKVLGHLDNIMNSDNFVFTSGCRIPRNCKIIVIDLRTKALDKITCCNEFNVFGDIVNDDLNNLQLEDTDENDVYHEIESNDNLKWYQSSYVMKGFKDCIVNGSSITNSWLNS